jgi:hypothetical protein
MHPKPLPTLDQAGIWMPRGLMSVSAADRMLVVADCSASQVVVFSPSGQIKSVTGTVPPASELAAPSAVIDADLYNY